MDTLKSEIKAGRDISDKALAAYMRNLKKIALLVTDKEFNNLNFLKEYKQVIEKLEGYTVTQLHVDNKFNKAKDLGKWHEHKLGTQKILLAGILTALSPTGRGHYKKGFEKVSEKYTDLLKAQSKEYEDKIADNKKTAKQEGNWVTLQELEKIRRKYGSYIKRIGYNSKNTEFKPGKEKRHRELLQKYLVASLYVLSRPLRNSYANMKIIKNQAFNKLDDKERNSNNYLVIVSRNKKFFSIGDHKTRKTYGIKRVPKEGGLNKKLNSVLNLWLKFNKSEYLLLNAHGQKMTTNGLTKFLFKVFEPTGKKISSTMLRHIYLSDKYDPKVYKEMVKDAEIMGHSVKMQQKVYVKKDDK